MYEDFFGMRRGAVPCINLRSIRMLWVYGYELETGNPERVSGTWYMYSLGLMPIIICSM